MDRNLPTENAPHTRTLEERVVFFFVCVGVITLTYGFLFLIDFLPEKPNTETVVEDQVVAGDSVVPEDEEAVSQIDPFPVAIIFDSLEREVAILNPESDNVAELDEALLSGIVRHPGSADFKDTGTIFLLGHSSYLPVVNNKNFQAFNGIQKLTWGDTIRLRSSDTEYVYSVDRVYQTKSTEAKVDIQYDVAKLVLATCNSFGTKDDRYVVEATLVESKPIGK